MVIGGGIKRTSLVLQRIFKKSHLRTCFKTNIFEKTRVSAGFFKMPFEKTRPVPGIIPGTGRDGMGRDSNTALDCHCGLFKDVLYPRFRYINQHTIYAQMTDLKPLQEPQILIICSSNPFLLINYVRKLSKIQQKTKFEFFKKF